VKQEINQRNNMVSRVGERKGYGSRRQRKLLFGRMTGVPRSKIHLKPSTTPEKGGVVLKN
jgi:hypothetical protein